MQCKKDFLPLRHMNCNYKINRLRLNRTRFKGGREMLLKEHILKKTSNGNVEVEITVKLKEEFIWYPFMILK